MLATFIVFAAALPLFASADVPNCSRTYTVQAGDYCDAISAANNASTYQLATVNSPTIDDTCSNLQVDQVLCLGTTGSDCTTTYVVQPNDTCDAITAAFGINATILYLNNPQINTDCSNIYVGEVLCTLGQVSVPPPAANSPIAAVSIAPGTATAAAPPPPTPATDNADIPECEDPNDNGEW